MRADLFPDVSLPSPDGSWSALLDYVHEIRWGPPYFQLRFDGLSLVNRFFGRDAVWSPDSSCLLVQEWLTLHETDGPLTRVVALDPKLRLELALKTITRGFAVPLSMSSEEIKFREERYAEGVSVTHRIAVPLRTAWTPICGLT